MYQTRCRFFTGYKPCPKNIVCDESCEYKDIPEKQIIIIHQEALGAVLRSTSLLPALKRRYPSSMITWVTRSPAQQLLKNNPLIDRILTTSSEDLLKLASLKFDDGFIIDKDISACGIAKMTSIQNTFGFLADPVNGAIVPANKEAFELWELGLNNHNKFFVNQKPETQLQTEALGLSYKRDEYQIYFQEEEKSDILARKKLWSNSNKKILVGINTGCSSKIAARRLSIDGHKRLIAELQRKYGARLQIILLGGPEEKYANQILAGDDIFQSPTNEGLRDGLISTAACDIVISGDSLGMHMGIALKKWVIAWFGPTCHQEIDLFERGIKVLTGAPCSPCWKQDCQKENMCYDQVSYDEILLGVDKGIQWLKKFSLSKQHTSEISFSPSL